MRFIELKSLSVGPIGLIEGHLECEKHGVTLGCLFKAILREEGATHLKNG